MSWSSGAVFAIGWVLLFVPLAAMCIIWFWKRRHIPVIGRRNPGLVVVTDILLMIYVCALCFQRVLGDKYPCLVNLWSAFLGTTILFNTYLWRTWVLVYDFKTTSLRVELAKDQEALQNSRWIRIRFARGSKFLWSVFIISIVIMVAPAGILSMDSEIQNLSGDDCDRKWGDMAVVVYVIMYLILFGILGWQLRAVDDAFKIKDELKYTGIAGGLAVVVWAAFNNALEDINVDVFPFSTLALLVVVAIAFCASTLWPLMISLYPAKDFSSKNIDIDVSTLSSIISTPEGFDSFKKFLESEFSVENILFYSACQDLKLFMRQNPQAGKWWPICDAIYKDYVQPNCANWVNLPATVLEDIEEKRTQKWAGKFAGGVDEDGEPRVQTIFDAAEKDIFDLLQTDSFRRYKRSPQFEALLKLAGGGSDEEEEEEEGGCCSSCVVM